MTERMSDEHWVSLRERLKWNIPDIIAELDRARAEEERLAGDKLFLRAELEALNKECNELKAALDCDKRDDRIRRIVREEIRAMRIYVEECSGVTAKPFEHATWEEKTDG